MEVEEYVKKRKELYFYLLNFIDTNDDSDKKFQELVTILKKQDILTDKEQTLEILTLISKIEENHHRTPDFQGKLEKIIQYILQEHETSISSMEIYKTFSQNKLLLIYLIEHRFLNIDKIEKKLVKNSDHNYFLYPFIKYLLEPRYQRMLYNQFYSEIHIENLEKKCRLGENDSPICTLIRQDSIDSFIQYVHQQDVPFSSLVPQSPFETHSILKQKIPSLIQYAFFFGSIQIIRYLWNNGVSLDESMWVYAVHSNNAEVIQFLEEKLSAIYDVKTYKIVLKEAIKCHHNEIADYIINNYKNSNKMIKTFGIVINESQNYYFFPKDVQQIIFSRRSKQSFNISDLFIKFKTITIPSFVTSIRVNVFRKCSSLTHVIIPSSITSIENGAFSECSSLKELEIPSSVVSIDSYAFNKCKSMIKITIPSSVTFIGNYAFRGCSSLVEIEIPSSIDKIGVGLFCECSSLKKIKIPSNVTSISDNAFFGCSSLEQIINQSNVKIDPEDLYECSSNLKITKK